MGFLYCLSTNFGLYVKVLNGGATVEDVNSVPEEHHEEQAGDAKAREIAVEDFYIYGLTFSSNDCYPHSPFSLVENIYFDVLCPPPDWA